jgi:hypothetical protein
MEVSPRGAGVRSGRAAWNCSLDRLQRAAFRGDQGLDGTRPPRSKDTTPTNQGLCSTPGRERSQRRPKQPKLAAKSPRRIQTANRPYSSWLVLTRRWVAGFKGRLAVAPNTKPNIRWIMPNEQEPVEMPTHLGTAKPVAHPFRREPIYQIANNLTIALAPSKKPVIPLITAHCGTAVRCLTNNQGISESDRRLELVFFACGTRADDR